MPKRVDFAVLGNGVRAAPSRIAGAGLGLFATKDFSKNEWITAYEGERIPRDDAKRLREANKDSHVATLEKGVWAIDGIKKPQEGKGGASFVNHSDDTSGRNCKLDVFYPTRDRLLGTLALRATKDIEEGDELLCSYGRDYWGTKGRATDDSDYLVYIEDSDDDDAT